MAYSVKGKGKRLSRLRRHQRVRKSMFGSAEKPRLVVTRSNRHMVAQLVNDYEHKTIVSASTMEDALRGTKDNKVAKATEVGKLIAQRAKAAGITQCVFDRGGNMYHGRVAAVAEGAREGGLSL